MRLLMRTVTAPEVVQFQQFHTRRDFNAYKPLCELCRVDIFSPFEDMRELMVSVLKIAKDPTNTRYNLLLAKLSLGDPFYGNSSQRWYLVGEQQLPCLSGLLARVRYNILSSSR